MRLLKKKLNDKEYWDKRYKNEDTSGKGSRGKFLDFKKEYVSKIIKELKITSIFDLGCGDARFFPKEVDIDYLGYDISEVIINRCRERFKHRKNMKFEVLSNEKKIEKKQMGISLEVLFHIINHKDYTDYLYNLFENSQEYVLIYSNDSILPYKRGYHVRNRCFTHWVYHNLKNWKLEKIELNPLEPSLYFFLYKRIGENESRKETVTLKDIYEYVGKIGEFYK